MLLAFFLANEQSAIELLDKYLRIELFDSALFVAATPPWKTRVPGNPKFWNARGAVAALLDELYRLATAPMRLPVSPVHGLRQQANMRTISGNSAEPASSGNSLRRRRLAALCCF